MKLTIALGGVFTAVAISLATASGAATVNGALPDGWVGVGGYGSGTPDGDMTAPPTTSGYTYVSTVRGVDGVGSLPGVGGQGEATNGSTLLTSSFEAKAGEDLTFFFNYMTSDGAGYSDYAWARLLDDRGRSVALLFTARTTPVGSAVPGFAMPNPDATLDPGIVRIDDGATDWSALGAWSGWCYELGCGNTGWVGATYNIAEAGTYRLQVGVTNWDDTLYDSAMAIAGAEIGGKPITPPSVPLPASAWFLMAGVGAMAAKGKRRR